MDIPPDYTTVSAASQKVLIPRHLGSGVCRIFDVTFGAPKIGSPSLFLNFPKNDRDYSMCKGVMRALKSLACKPPKV